MGFYGVTVSDDGNANTTIGQFSPAQEISFRERIDHSGSMDQVQVYIKTAVGYSLGTGGSITMTIETDDGTANHRPSGVVLKTKNLVTPNTGGVYLGIFDLTASPLVVAAGALLHFVFRNGDGSPTANYVSINGLYLGTTPTPLQHGGITDLDRCLLAHVAGPFTDMHDRYPILDYRMTDGYHGGQAYYGAENFTEIYGPNHKVRQNITVASGPQFVDKVSFYCFRQSGSTSPCTLKVQDSGGVTLATATVPLASAATSVFAPSGSGPDAGCDWVIDVPLNSTVLLANGQNYFLEASAPLEALGTGWATKAIEGHGSGSFGIALAAANVFDDGYWESTTNGTVWNQYLSNPGWKMQTFFNTIDAAPVRAAAWGMRSSG